MIANQELMDIGKHCAHCKQIDFLPFVCDHCKLLYCSSHRSVEAHHCKVFQDPFKTNASPRSSTSRPTSPPVSSLFPDRDLHRRQLNNSLNEPPKPTTIKEKTPSALSKLKKFLSVHNKKLNGSKNSLFRPKVSKATNKILVISTCKKEAKGDAKVPSSERVYVWCIYIPEGNDFSKIPSEKSPVWVSRTWPVGRALDSIASTLNIKNINNKTNDPAMKLSVFRDIRDNSDGSDPIMINYNGRVNKELHDGDTIYLVRGADI